MSLSGGLTYSTGDARQISALVAQSVQSALQGHNFKPAVQRSKTIVTKECPAGMVECNVQEARKLGLECPIPEVAGMQYMTFKTNGNLCSKPRDIDALKDYAPNMEGPNIHKIIEKLSAQLLEENPESLAALLKTTKTNPVPYYSSRDRVSDPYAYDKERVEGTVGYNPFVNARENFRLNLGNNISPKFIREDATPAGTALRDRKVNTDFQYDTVRDFLQYLQDQVGTNYNSEQVTSTNQIDGTGKVTRRSRPLKYRVVTLAPTRTGFWGAGQEFSAEEEEQILLRNPR